MCINEWLQYSTTATAGRRQGSPSCPTCRVEVQLIQRLFGNLNGSTTEATSTTAVRSEEELNEHEILFRALRSAERRLETTTAELEVARMEIEDFDEIQHPHYRSYSDRDDGDMAE